MEVEELRQKLMPLLASLDERGRRLVLAAEARSLGWGGIELVHRAIGFSRSALRRGIRELDLPPPSSPFRIRRPGGGRKRAAEKDPTLRSDLEALVAPTTRGDPESRLQWNSKSLRGLSREFTAQGHRVSTWTVAGLLVEAGYRLQGDRKTKEGSRHPDRNAQFEHINATVIEQQRADQPVISVDAK
ncbi:MAG: ISAzo13-like element transposase-related protein, partial [Thermoplasmata archaeon]